MLTQEANQLATHALEERRCVGGVGFWTRKPDAKCANLGADVSRIELLSGLPSFRTPELQV